MKYQFLFLFLCLGIISFGQTYPKDSFVLKTDSLKSLLIKADTVRGNENWVDNIGINKLIGNQLSEILSLSHTVSFDLDSLPTTNFLGNTHSKDKRLWIFNWDENTGGSFRSNICVVHYRSKFNLPKESYYNSSDEGVFCYYGAMFYDIYKLKSSSKDIYLCLGSVLGCNTCCADIASVIELTNDIINFNYPAFTTTAVQNELSDKKTEFTPCFVLDSRCGDIDKFEYDPKTQTIYFIYHTNDLTPVRLAEDQKSKIIKGILKWNGTKFIEK